MIRKLQLLTLIVLSGSIYVNAQEKNIQKSLTSTFRTSKESKALMGAQDNSSQKRLSLCSDKVNYVGITGGLGTQCGGLAPNQDYIFMQAYPDYSGEITRVDFYASKIVSNVNAKVKIWALDASGLPTGGFLASANVNVNGGWAEYGAAFSSAVTVGSYGFAAAVEAPLLTDSFLLLESCCNFQGLSFLSFDYDDINFLGYFSGGTDLIIRPTIRFSMPTLGLTINPQPACVSATTSFLGNITPINLPSHFGNMFYNTVSSFKLNFGDGSPLSTLNPTQSVNHTYSTSGSKNLSYNLQYVGWTSTCNETYTNTLAVNSSAISSFSYSTSNLLLTVVNNSTGGSGYNWNFGDLTSSTLQNPPVHDYGQTQGAGTYVVELTTTSPCGNGYQAKTITVQQGTSIEDNDANFDESIFVYPNPANSIVHLDLDFAKARGEMDVFIADATGRILRTKNINSFIKGTVDFEIKDLAKGTYFIKLSTDSRNTVRTFVKQ